MQTLYFLTALPTRQDGVENCDKTFYRDLKVKSIFRQFFSYKFIFSSKIGRTGIVSK